MKDDGLGYDIKSFDKCGKKKLIEVKQLRDLLKLLSLFPPTNGAIEIKITFLFTRFQIFKLIITEKKDGTITKYKGKDLENILNLTPFTFRATFK